jgi:hypothetical protein
MLGTSNNVRIGHAGMIARPDGKGILLSSLYDNGVIADAGAVSLLDGASALPAALDPTPSVFHTVAASGAGMASAQTVAYDPPRGQIVVGRPASNRVTLLRVVDAVFADEFE